MEKTVVTEIYLIARTIEKIIFERFRVETTVQIDADSYSISAIIDYVEPVPAYLSDEIEAYVYAWMDRNPKTN